MLLSSGRLQLDRIAEGKPEGKNSPRRAVYSRSKEIHWTHFFQFLMHLFPHPQKAEETLPMYLLSLSH